jgi:hypothetical protein
VTEGSTTLYAGCPGDHPAPNKSREFQVVTAARALIRRETFETAGAFDTAFVNGYEDERATDTERLLGKRSREAFEALKENTRLKNELLEAEERVQPK